MENEVDLNHLLPSEYEKIIAVLRRDRELRTHEDARIQQLKRDLAHLRRRAALRPGVNADRCCARCLELLGRILNRGALCPLCHKKVCKSCRRFSPPVPQHQNSNVPSNSATTLTSLQSEDRVSENEWLCVVCHKRMQLKAVSGEWMEEFSNTSQKKVKTPAGDRLRKVLHETQRKSLLSSIESKTKSFSTIDLSSAPPPKPPRTFAHVHNPDICDVQKAETPSNNKESIVKVNSETVQLTKNMAANRPKIKSASVSSEDNISPKLSPRVSPWNGIEAEPKIPVRSLRAASFGHLMSVDYIDPWLQKEEHSLDDSHSMVSLHSHSLSGEMSNDSHNASLDSKSRRKISALQKQHGISESLTTTDNQRSSSIDTTDSGIFSPGIKMGDNTSSKNLSPHSSLKSTKSESSSPKISDRIDSSENVQSPLLSAKSESDTRYSSETSEPFPHLTMSDASSSEEALEENSKVSKKVIFKKRKQSCRKETPRKVESKLWKDKKEKNASGDESGNSLRSSPHGRMRIRHRTLSGGSEDGRKREIPQITVPECNQPSPCSTLSVGSSERDSLGRHDDDVDQIFAYQSRSQMSLSSYGGRSESVTSVYSAAGGGRYGTVTVTGEVFFSLKYNYKASAFEVLIKECRNLAPVDIKRNRSDPYVKVYLLPDRTKSGKRKTKVKKHTLNPVFDELLKFQVTTSELEKRVLWLSVWHSDRFGRNDFLGEVVLELGHDCLESGEIKCYPLQERTELFDAPVSYKGDIILALKYVPPDVTSRKPNKKHGSQTKGSLHVLVREARNLMATRSNGTSDPFCKSYLLPDKSKGGKQKTSVFKKTCNPKWNHTFVYDDVTVDDLRERCLELTIWDYDKITSNDFLGGVRLCLGTGKHQGRDVDWMDSSGEEVSLWYTMIERPNTWVDGSLLLRPSMQNRKIP